MVGSSAPGRNRTHFYYSCTRQNHEGGKYSCSAPRIPAEAIEEAIIGRIREISRSVEAREKIVERALSRLDVESGKLQKEGEILRQQQKMKADIGRLIEVLKSLGASGLTSVQEELGRLEKEEKGIRRQISLIEKQQEPLDRLTDDAKNFIQNWTDMGELLDAATDEERKLVIRHYVEVLELHAKDAKSGTYALRLFPEVRPDRGFDWTDSGPETPETPENTNGGTAPEDDTADSLTDSRLVCISDGKAPRGVHHTSQGLVDLGAYAIKHLCQRREYDLHPWNPIPERLSTAKPPRYAPLRLANFYQSLLDSGRFESKADMARFLGVSRARVTQVLKRLESSSRNVG